MTFLESQTLLADLLDDPNFGYLNRTVVKLRLNLAARELQDLLVKAGDGHYTRCVKTNTVVGQKAYALPVDFYALTLLEKVISGSGDTAETEQINYITSSQRYQIAVANGEPCYYWFEKNNLILRSTPNRVQEIHLEYAYQVADLINDGDVFDAPAQYHEFVPILAAKKCFIKDGRPTAPVEDDLKRLQVELNKIATLRRLDGPRMVVTTEGYL